MVDYFHTKVTPLMFNRVLNMPLISSLLYNLRACFGHQTKLLKWNTVYG